MKIFLVFFLQLDNVEIRGKKGSLHFIRFPTAEMGNFLALAKAKGSECRRVLWKFMENISLTITLFPFKVAKLLTTVCATGGGAFKFEDEFHKVSFAKRIFMRRWHKVSTPFLLTGSQHATPEI